MNAHKALDLDNKKDRIKEKQHVIKDLHEIKKIKREINSLTDKSKTKEL